MDYINSQRVDRAAVLLATTDRSIAAVAAAVGILDVNYFTKIFKKQLGKKYDSVLKMFYPAMLLSWYTGYRMRQEQSP